MYLLVELRQQCWKSMCLHPVSELWLSCFYRASLWLQRAILNKSWRQHSKKQQLYGHLPPITKTTKIRRTRHAERFWRIRDEPISDILIRAKAGRPARTYIQQICVDTECSPEDLPEVMDKREGWRERVRDICADGVTWWWWWWYGYNGFFEETERLAWLCLYICIYAWKYIYIYIHTSSSSSSSCRAASTDLPDLLSPPVSIVHRSR